MVIEGCMGVSAIKTQVKMGVITEVAIESEAELEFQWTHRATYSLAGTKTYTEVELMVKISSLWLAMKMTLVS